MAIEIILERLEIGGRLAIMIYYGHEGGDMEKDAVLDFVSALDQKNLQQCYINLNQIHQPPFGYD